MTREPWECAWPKGCAQPRALSEDGVLCYWHAKVLAGLIDTQDHRRQAARFDVLSHEQRELAEALRVLGAQDWVIERALRASS